MNKEICDEEFNKYFKEETNKQTFKIKMEEPMKLIINYDYYFLLLKKLERLESKIKMLEKYKDDYKRMKDNFDSKVDVIENLHKEIDRLNNIINRIDNFVDRTIEVIKHQPSDNDEWILERLNGIKYLTELKENK